MLRLLPKIKCITKREQYGTERKCNVRALTGICEFHQSYFKRLWLQTEGQDVCTFWLIVWNVSKSTCDRLKSKWVQNRELKQRQRQLEWQKSNRFIVAKQQLCTCNHAFLYISLLSLHDYSVKVSNFTFCQGREHKTTTFFFFSWTLIQSFRIQLQKNCQHLTN